MDICCWQNGRKQFFLNRFIRLLTREQIPLKIVDTSGTVYQTVDGRIDYTLHIKDNRFFKALLRPDAFSIGNAYVNGYFDISGNLFELYEKACARFLSRHRPKSLYQRLFSRFKNFRESEKRNIEHHYNVSAEFYRLFLGPTMGYTCGYYARPDAHMDEAQNEKMDIICRKLRLKPTENLLDIGCGWGILPYLQQSIMGSM